MKPAILVLLSMTAFAQTTPDVTTLLREIAEYAEDGASWQIEGEVKNSDDPAPESFKFTARSPLETRYEVSGPIPGQIVCDAKNAWLYSVSINAYRLRPATEALCAPIPDRWKQISDRLESPVFVGKGKFQSAGHAADCDQVRGQTKSKGGSGPVLKRTLCIDRIEKLVRWETVQSQYRTSTYTFARIERGAPTAPSQFAFEPPANSQRSELRIPMATWMDEENPSADPAVTSPRLVTKVEPQYDDVSRRAQIQGTVGLYCIVNVKGHVDLCRVIRTLVPKLDHNAIAAVNRWRFSPATKDGKPVPFGATIAVTFKLR